MLYFQRCHYLIEFYCCLSKKFDHSHAKTKPHPIAPNILMFAQFMYTRCTYIKPLCSSLIRDFVPQTKVFHWKLCPLNECVQKDSLFGTQVHFIISNSLRFSDTIDIIIFYMCRLYMCIQHWLNISINEGQARKLMK